MPDLPEERLNHGSFITKSGALAVCGGSWAGKPFSSDCLVLNSTSKQWERGVLGPLLGNSVLGVINLDNGTYMVHPTTSSYLPHDDHNWVAGPASPLDGMRLFECATGISSTSFLAFSSRSVHQFDSSIAGPSNTSGWLTDIVWPELMEERHAFGCATLGSFAIVAGGRDTLDDVLRSVEIISLVEFKTLDNANMLKPRFDFKLVVLGTTLLAVGGSNDTSIEMWEGLGEPWKDTSLSLSSSLRQFSALSYSDLECFAGPLPQHSCPTLDGSVCTFPFTKGWSIPFCQ